MAYEFHGKYKKNIENEPAYKEMIILQREMRKWTSAISCLGREPFVDKEYGSFDEGGAINALWPKKGYGGASVKPADPEEAHTLIGRSVEYIKEAYNLFEDFEFEDRRNELITLLNGIRDRLLTADGFTPIQRLISRTVDILRPIEAGYAARIYDCTRELQKTYGSNAAWAAISVTTLGLINKPEN